MREHSYKSSENRFKIEQIKGKWVVFEIRVFLGRTFKTKIGEANTKKEAEGLCV